MTIEVVESRSDDDTCSCYSSSAAPSESEEEVRDGGGETFADKSGKGESSVDWGPPAGVGGITDTRGRTTTRGEPTNQTAAGAGGLLVIPESIQEEEIGPTPSSELSASSKETETTEETLDVSYGSSEDAPTGDSNNGNAPEDRTNRAAEEEEEEDLANAPSDEAVMATDEALEKDSTNPDENGPGMNNNDAEFFVESSKEEGANPDAMPGEAPRQNEKDGLALARQQWAEAMMTLQKNPALMTGDILKLALHHRAPLDVVQFMVGLNPDSAGVPRSGPSALQVAVRRGCTLDIVEAIVRACPYALFDSCGQTYDPLALARIHRREDRDLIKMLSCPISHWISDKEQASKAVRFEPLKAPPPPGRAVPAPRQPNTCILPPPPPPPPILKSPSRLTREEKREMGNIKLITAAIVKAQKRQMAETEENRRKIKTLAKSEARTRREMIKFVDERMKKNAKAHLVSLDMKERAFLSRIDSVSKEISGNIDEASARQERLDGERERRDLALQQTVEDAMSTIVAAADKIGKGAASYDTKLADLAARVEQLEDKVDASHTAGCSEEPSFEIESIPETTSTEHLFSDDFTCNGIDDSHIGEYTSDQIHSSFSSEWNASTQGLVTNEQIYHDASWWQAVGADDRSSKKRRWKRWFKNLW